MDGFHCGSTICTWVATARLSLSKGFCLVRCGLTKEKICTNPTAPVPVVIMITVIEGSVSNLDTILDLSAPMIFPSIRTYFILLDWSRDSAKSSVVFQDEKMILCV